MKLRKGNLAFAGFMSTGKDKVGKIVVEQARIRFGINMKFVSTDKLIIAAYQGMPITEIFRVHKEPHFRATEDRIIRAEFAAENSLFSLGGGAFAQPPELGGDELRAFIREHSLAVWLDVDLSIIRKRLAEKNDDRPLAQDLVAMEKLYWDRQSYYAQADIRIPVPVEVPAEEVAERVLQAVSWKMAA